MPPISGYGASDFGSLNMTSLINMLSLPWSNVKTMMSAIIAEGTNLNPVDLMQMQFALAIYFQDETLLSSIVSLSNQMSKSTVQNIQR
jgi:hypothetical protein